MSDTFFSVSGQSTQNPLVGVYAFNLTSGTWTTIRSDSATSNIQTDDRRAWFQGAYFPGDGNFVRTLVARRESALLIMLENAQYVMAGHVQQVSISSSYSADINVLNGFPSGYQQQKSESASHLQHSCAHPSRLPCLPVGSVPAALIGCAVVASSDRIVVCALLSHALSLR